MNIAYDLLLVQQDPIHFEFAKALRTEMQNVGYFIPGIRQSLHQCTTNVRYARFGPTSNKRASYQEPSTKPEDPLSTPSSPVIVNDISHTLPDQNFTNEVLSKGISCPGGGDDPPSSSGRPDRTPESESNLAKAKHIVNIVKQMF